MNWWAIAAAAAGFYAVGALIYGLLFTQLWLNLSGHTKEALKPYAARMALSPLPPILTAIGLGILFKAVHIDRIDMGMVTGAKVWFFFLLPARAYSFIYGDEKKGLLLLDGAHLLLGCLVAGAIIAGFR
jgi:hypothetical protein